MRTIVKPASCTLSKTDGTDSNRRRQGKTVTSNVYRQDVAKHEAIYTASGSGNSRHRHRQQSKKVACHHKNTRGDCFLLGNPPLFMFQ